MDRDTPNPKAFPQAIETGAAFRHGMTLRDYFAGQALASIVGSSEFNAATCLQLADISYRCADAMLKERSK